jgi:hypothetical protein
MAFLEIYNFFFTKCLLSCIAFKKNLSYNYIACQINATKNNGQPASQTVLMLKERR